jgi:formate hydrogenlyase subunit 6/NADH:ubiquinone oxidoreductase subunit I
LLCVVCDVALCVTACPSIVVQGRRTYHMTALDHDALTWRTEITRLLGDVDGIH